MRNWRAIPRRGGQWQRSRLKIPSPSTLEEIFPAFFSLTEVARGAALTKFTPSLPASLHEVPRGIPSEGGKGWGGDGIRQSFAATIQPNAAFPQVAKMFSDKSNHLFQHRASSAAGHRSFVSTDGGSFGRLSFQSVEYIKLKAMSEEIQERLKEERQDRRKKAQRVFKPHAPSIFSVTLPHVNEDGCIDIGRDGYARTKPLNRGGMRSETSSLSIRGDGSGSSSSQKGMPCARDANSWKLPCGGLSVNQILQRLIDRETPSKQTLFTGLEVQRLMRGVPQASEFVIVLFWYVVFRGRRTRVEELLIGRCERLFVTFQELLPDDDSPQPRSSLPSYEHLELLVEELQHMIHLRMAWEKAEEEGMVIGMLSQSDSSKLQSTMHSEVSSNPDLFHEFMRFRYVYTNKYLPSILKSKTWPKEEDIKQLADALDLLAVSREEYLELVQLEARTYRRLALLFSEIFHTFRAHKTKSNESALKAFNTIKFPSSVSDNPIVDSPSAAPAAAKDFHTKLGHRAQKNMYTENNVAKLKMKDIVIDTYLSIAARITYYALVYCFPNDVYTGEIFDRRFRADLLRLLLYWSSGVVLVHTSAVGWPVPCEEDFLHDAAAEEEERENDTSSALAPLGLLGRADSSSLLERGWETPNLVNSLSRGASPLARTPFEGPPQVERGGHEGSERGSSILSSSSRLLFTRPGIGDAAPNPLRLPVVKPHATSEGASLNMKKGDKGTNATCTNPVVHKEPGCGSNLDRHRPTVLTLDSIKGCVDRGPFSPQKEGKADTATRCILPRVAHRHSSKWDARSRKSSVKSALLTSKEQLRSKCAARKSQIFGIGNENAFNNVDVSIANGEHRLMAEFHHYQRHARRLLIDLHKYTSRQYKFNLDFDPRRFKRYEKSVDDDYAANSRLSANVTLKLPGLESKGKETFQNANRNSISCSASREEVIGIGGQQHRKSEDSHRQSGDSQALNAMDSMRKCYYSNETSLNFSPTSKSKRVKNSAISFLMSRKKKKKSVNPLPLSQPSHGEGVSQFSQFSTYAMSVCSSPSENSRHAGSSSGKEDQVIETVKKGCKSMKSQLSNSSLLINRKAESSQFKVLPLMSTIPPKETDDHNYKSTRSNRRPTGISSFTQQNNSFHSNNMRNTPLREDSLQSFPEEALERKQRKFPVWNQMVDLESLHRSPPRVSRTRSCKRSFSQMKLKLKRTLAQHALETAGLSSHNYETNHIHSFSSLSSREYGAPLPSPTVATFESKGGKNGKRNKYHSPTSSEDAQSSQKEAGSRGVPYSYLLSTYPLATCSNDAREYLCLRCGIQYSEVPIPEAHPIATKAAYLVSLQRQLREQEQEASHGKGRHSKHSSARNPLSSSFSTVTSASSREVKGGGPLNEKKGFNAPNRKSVLQTPKHLNSRFHPLSPPMLVMIDSNGKKSFSGVESSSLFRTPKAIDKEKRESRISQTYSSASHRESVYQSKLTTSTDARHSPEIKARRNVYFQEVESSSSKKEHPGSALSAASDMSTSSLVGEIKYLSVPPNNALATKTNVLLSVSPFIVECASSMLPKEMNSTVEDSRSSPSREIVPHSTNNPLSNVLNGSNRPANGSPAEDPLGHRKIRFPRAPRFPPPLQGDLLTSLHGEMPFSSVFSAPASSVNVSLNDSHHEEKQNRMRTKKLVSDASAVVISTSMIGKPPPLLTPIHPYRIPATLSLPANFSRRGEGRLPQRGIPPLHTPDPEDGVPRPLRFLNLQAEALARERMLVRKVEMIANRSKASQQVYMKAHLAAMGNVQNAKSREMASLFERKVKAALSSL